jgi:hypothetical protein
MMPFGLITICHGKQLFALEAASGKMMCSMIEYRNMNKKGTKLTAQCELSILADFSTGE